MKRFLALLLAETILLSLVACGKVVPAETSAPEKEEKSPVKERYDEEKRTYYYSSDTISEDQLFFRQADAEEYAEGIAENGDRFEYVSDELIVLAAPGQSYKQMEKLAERYQMDIAGFNSLCDAYQFRCREKQDQKSLDKLIAEIKQDPAAEEAYYNTVTAIEDESYALPNDPWTDSKNDPADPVSTDIVGGYNWGVEAVNAPWFWQNYKLENIPVGVIDTMFVKDHEDLVFKAILRNQYEWSNPLRGHGTHVAGIIGAVHNNGKGIAGVLKNAEIYASRYGETEDGKDSVFATLTLVGVMLLQDVRVINFSIGYPVKNRCRAKTDAEAAQIMLKRFLEKGLDFILVTAAGNSGETEKYRDAKESFWTCAIEDTEIKNRLLVVGNAYRQRDGGSYRRAEESCDGDRVDLMAPGSWILSCTDPLWGVPYGIKSGTSMAAPFVTAACAALWAYYPQLNGAEIAALIKETADIPVADSDVGMLDIKAAFGGYEENELDHKHLTYDEIRTLYAEGSNELPPADQYVLSSIEDRIGGWECRIKAYTYYSIPEDVVMSLKVGDVYSLPEVGSCTVTQAADDSYRYVELSDGEDEYEIYWQIDKWVIAKTSRGFRQLQFESGESTLFVTPETEFINWLSLDGTRISVQSPYELKANYPEVEVYITLADGKVISMTSYLAGQ